jgi:hypothetical protein
VNVGGKREKWGRKRCYWSVLKRGFIESVYYIKGGAMCNVNDRIGYDMI